MRPNHDGKIYKNCCNLKYRVLFSEFPTPSKVALSSFKAKWTEIFANAFVEDTEAYCTDFINAISSSCHWGRSSHLRFRRKISRLTSSRGCIPPDEPRMINVSNNGNDYYDPVDASKKRSR
ncbi:hypothetical protein TNIN_237791 [Trichonephila inaurata madagascariensis]|uniref:Uncharacterized protein n=1 Tax=Trichonephila inaurata madagascariensis TaxID=2747483 RepID=A0A8X6YWI5_9ARAC|nr:hypothetical protein TNIN_237791 [Trichonephila inaurata madagascariensis]